MQNGLNFRKQGFARAAFFPLGMLTLATLAGCGGDAESYVTGTVTVDGASIDHGSVTFAPVTPGGRSASGSISSSGDYTVQAGQTGGLPAGEYIVKVNSRGPSTPHPRGGPPGIGKLLTPEKYSTTSTSDLKFTVTPGSNEIDLELVSK